jgi:putative ABC transport system permease protein
VIQLALRNLISERTRFAFSAAGIGFAVFLITVLIGIYQGWNQKVGGFVDDVQADGWVARAGTTDFINAASILPDSMGEQLASTPGVARVSPMLVRPMSFQHDGKKIDTQLVGYDESTGVGGPPKIVEGDGNPGDGEIVIDAALERIEGIGMGDTPTSSGKSFKVVGISTGGNFAFTQAAFISLNEAQKLLDMPGLVTFWTFEAKPGASISGIQSSIESSQSGTSVFTSKQFASATRHRILDSMLPIVEMIVGLAFVVGIAITSLTIYTATIERAREFGVMKAIGFNNLDLYKLVLVKSMITGAIGFVFGVVLTLVVSRTGYRLVPQLIMDVRPIDVALVLLITVVMAAGAAIVPARRVGGVDPAIAFKG